MAGRGEQKFSDEERAAIRKLASVYGVTSASRKYAAAESSIRDWQRLYRRELCSYKIQRSEGGSGGLYRCSTIEEAGKPPLLGEKLDWHLQDKILAMRSRETLIGSNIVIRKWNWNIDEAQESNSQLF